jgi:hypothetical protein
METNDHASFSVLSICTHATAVLSVTCSPNRSMVVADDMRGEGTTKARPDDKAPRAPPLVSDNVGIFIAISNFNFQKISERR